MAHTRRIHGITSLYPGSNKYYTPYIGKGEVIFTGPDAISNQKVTILNPTYVGIGTMSPEGTSNAEYLWRPGKRWAFHPPKSARVGAIGWGVHLFHDIKRLKSGHQIDRGTFRQECEDRHTHLYQNPWYPDPRYEQQSDSNNADGYKDHGSNSRESQTSSRQRASPGSFRSHTPTPHSHVHYDNGGTQLMRRPKSCTPSQRTRSGTMSSSTSVQSQLFVL